MKQPTKTRRPGPGLALLGLAALGLVTGATVWLHTGWSAVDLTLTDEIADAAQLEGFTLSGLMRWGNQSNTLHFTLQNGTLETALHLDDDQFQRQTEVYTQRTLSVRPQDRDAVNEAARLTQTLENGTRILKSEATLLRPMYTLQLPDGTSLRLAGEDLTLDEAAELRAEDVQVPPDILLSPLGTYYDYTCSDLTNPDVFSVWTPVNEQPFVLGAGYGVCWTQDDLGRAPGLYRAHGLTADEIYALPADGVRYDEEILCATTEFGTLEPFYCPDDAQLALAGASLGDGSTLLLYYTTDDMLCADLVNAAGQCTDHRELAELPGMVRIDAKLMPRTRSQDAVLLLPPYGGQDENGAWDGDGPWLVALRVENGTFTRATALKPDFALGDDAAVLDEAGNKVLFAGDNILHYNHGFSLYARGSLRTDYINLRVMELDTGRTTYMGHIETGAQRDWGSQAPSRVILYDTLQRDGGNLP